MSDRSRLGRVPGATPRAVALAVRLARKDAGPSAAAMDAASAPIETDDALWNAANGLLGYRIARRAVCPEHQAPFQFLSDLYFRRESRAVGLGPRGGGKTVLVSLLEWLRCTTAPTHVWHGGSVQEQAQRCYEAIAQYSRLPWYRAAVAASLATRTRWRNGSVLEIHSATLHQTSGAHPDIKAADELDQWSWDVYQQFLGMGTKGDAQTLFISTRERAVGLMQRLVDEAAQSKLRLYHWCIWETKLPCQICTHAHCALWDECRGRYRHSEGHRSVANIADKFLTVDRDTWESQYLCLRPGRSSLCFPDYVDIPGEPAASNVSDAAEYSPDYPVEVWCDDNVAQPRAMLFVQEDPLGRLRVFDEYYVAGELQDAGVKAALARLVAAGQARPSQAIVPTEATALRIAWHEEGVPTASPYQYRRAQGAAVLARLIRTAAGERRLVIHPRCQHLRHSLSIAYRKRVGPGQYGDEPEKHGEDHCQDAAMYGAWLHRIE